MSSEHVYRVIDGTCYNTKRAQRLGYNYEYDDYCDALYKTRRGRYFVARIWTWEYDGEPNRVKPLSKDEAMELYAALPKHEVEFEEAFRSELVEEA